MDGFIEMENGEWIALSEVVRVARATWGILKLYDADNVCLGVAHDDRWADAIKAATPTVAAVAGAHALWVFAQAHTRPTEADVWVEHVPILAWRIVGDTAEPVYLDPETSRAEVKMIPRGDGTWMEPGVGDYASLEEARRVALTRGQEAWDYRESKKDRENPPSVTR